MASANTAALPRDGWRRRSSAYAQVHAFFSGLPAAPEAVCMIPDKAAPPLPINWRRFSASILTLVQEHVEIRFDAGEPSSAFANGSWRQDM